MKIFVTGAAGFIGSNYVRWVLANTDHSVTVYDSLTYAGNMSTLKDVDDNPRYSFVKGNICQPGDVMAAMKGHDSVVHFAAESHVDRSIVGSEDFILTNCFGTNVIMDAARRIGRLADISRGCGHLHQHDAYQSMGGYLGSTTQRGACIAAVFRAFHLRTLQPTRRPSGRQ